MRQTDLTVCMEQVHKPHNFSAVIRSCDAVGIHSIHAVWEQRTRLRRGTAMGAQNWVGLEEYSNIEDAVQCLKKQNMQILVTHLSHQAVDFRDIDYTLPTAIILGQEKRGATAQAIAAADQEIVIPMSGIVQSLNVSVAAALILYEAQRQRQIAGLYDVQHLSEDECQRILFEGSYPALKRMCQRKGIAYPRIDEFGQIEADASWWKQLQFTQQEFAGSELGKEEP